MTSLNELSLASRNDGQKIRLNLLQECDTVCLWWIPYGYTVTLLSLFTLLLSVYFHILIEFIYLFCLRNNIGNKLWVLKPLCGKCRFGSI